MCGIFGLCGISGKPVSVSTQEMATSLQLMQHRGPNAGRLALFGGEEEPPLLLELDKIPNKAKAPLAADVATTLALGHRRLSIIDLSEAAHQPMASGSGRFWMTYNGELYNYRELREELKTKGFTFTTQSDTEVLLALYEAEGAGMVSRLNGMFALAIWDTQDRALFLARDRYGIKPLYTTRMPDGAIAFASEVKSLLALPGVTQELNPQGLYEHFTFQTTLFEKTLVKNISLLEAGSFVMISPEQNTWHQEKYWEPVFQDTPYNPNHLQRYTQDVRECLEQAISRQLVGEVPIGAFLSGGMDTGAITAVAGRQIENLNTFTCGFDTRGVTEMEQYTDERVEAQALAQTLGSHHHEMVLDHQALPQSLERLVWHLDDFRAGISYQNERINELVSQHVTVVLSGVGGDELFAGYPWRHQPLLSLTDSKAFSDAYYQHWARLLSDAQKQQLFSKKILAGLTEPDTKTAFNRVLGRCQAQHPLHKALGYEMTTFLQGLLIVDDRLSMAHSIELRVPFLDNDLVDLCLSLPAETKLSPDGTPKAILKEALEGLLPDEVIHRRKQGFTPPEMTWFRGPTRGYVEEMLLSDQAIERGLFEPDALKHLITEHMDGHANHRFLIWSLLCLEQWQRLFLDQDALSPPKSTQSVI
ncbi:MAG: asparagine synthase (glutamine-hydrolyzing) [Vampirovibrio sp.]|nr:asparagine synthase (glutamine-hydrolyzing) [Vampirovibrio sp.]